MVPGSFVTMIARFDVKEETKDSLKKFKQDIQKLTNSQKQVEQTIFETKDFILDFTHKAKSSLMEYAGFLEKTKDYIKEKKDLTKEIGQHIIQEYRTCMGNILQRNNYGD